MARFDGFQRNAANRVKSFMQMRDALSAPQSDVPVPDTLSEKINREYDEYARKFEAYLKWAESTKLADAIVPFVGKPFAESYEWREDDLGRPKLVLFPWFTRGTPAHRSTASINAWISAFGTQRYAGVLEVHRHMRLFDKRQGTETNVAALYQDFWRRYDWRNGDFRQDMKFAGKLNWVNKHEEIDLMLRAIANQQRYEATFFDADLVSEADRKLTQRLDLTVAEVITMVGQDAEAAESIHKVGQIAKAVNDPKSTVKVTGVYTGSIIVDGVDLSSLVANPNAKPAVIMVKTPFSAVAYPQTVEPGNTRALTSIATMYDEQGNLKPGFSVSIKK